MILATTDMNEKQKGAGIRVLASRVYGCLLDSLVHEKHLILGKKTPLILVCVFRDCPLGHLF